MAIFQAFTVLCLEATISAQKFPTNMLSDMTIYQTNDMNNFPVFTICIDLIHIYSIFS